MDPEVAGSKPVTHPTHFSLNYQSTSRHPFSVIELRFISEANNLFENALHWFDPGQRSNKPQVTTMNWCVCRADKLVT